MPATNRPHAQKPDGLIAPADLDAACLCALLDEAGIDHEGGGEEGAIYVTGLAFPF